MHGGRELRKHRQLRLKVKGCSNIEVRNKNTHIIMVGLRVIT
jgi:hypothetical protein